MKKLYFLFLLFWTTVYGFAQCPTGQDFVFTTQAQVNAFGASHGSCTDLTLGNITIGYTTGSTTTDITDLTPLTNIKTITGFLHIRNSSNLVSLNGLNNLETIGGYLYIGNNVRLTNVDGLSNLESIGGYLSIGFNAQLTNLNGLSSLESIGRYLYIQYSPQLTNVDGLSSLKTIGEYLRFYNNSQLTNLNGLSNLETIGGYLTIQSNTQLTNISGLANIDPDTITHLYLENNTNLAVCNLTTFCTYLANPVATHPRTITNNATGCESDTAITASCSVPCPTGQDLVFTSQAEVDTFGAMHGSCTDLTLGNITIGYTTGSTTTDITDLTPLANIKVLTGYLTIRNNSNLVSLNGLNNLETIGRYLSISFNDQLTNLDGLSSLETIGSYLTIFSNRQLTNVNGLSSLKTIGSYLTIFSNAQLTNVNGLSSLKTIGGNLDIGDNSQLTNLNGLSNLESIGGSLYMGSNAQLTNVNGLSNLKSIGGYLSIRSNNGLTNVNGLSGLETIGGDLYIGSNAQLTNVNGLSNLKSIGGDLDIGSNTQLTNLYGLSNLESIGGYLSIEHNDRLTNILGLTNIDPDTITHLYLENNINLAVCNLSNFCIYLANPVATHPRTINGNKTTCLNESAVISSCSDSSCPTGEDFVFITQAQVNDFGDLYGNCTELTLGNVTIGNVIGSTTTDITDLTPLANIRTITGYLYIRNTPNLVSINGLNSVETIGSYLNIHYNDQLTNLDGLSSLETIGGNLYIGSNAQLTDLDGLSSLQAIGGYLNITSHAQLTNISGLANIDPATITNLYLHNNTNLVVCNITSLCEYLSNSSNLRNITNNATGCQSDTEIITACNTPACPTGQDFVFTSQAEIDAFGAMYASCTDLTLGNVTIGYTTAGSTTTDITDLTPLANIKAITGYLYIIKNPNLVSFNGLNNVETIGDFLDFSYNTQLTNLTGLSSLETVGGNLHILQNSSLTNLDGLNNLKNIEGQLAIQSNNGLTNLNGLSSLESVEGNLTIYENSQLENVNGLSNLESIGRHFNIMSNSSLTNVNGLSNLESIGGFLYIRNNTQLTNLDGLSNLESIGKHLYIGYNAQLDNINGLSSLKTIGEYLYIGYNAQLDNINGLSSLESIGGYLNIGNNTQLTNVNGLSSLESIGGYLYIYSNAQLTNISGLANIDPDTITHLYLQDNTNLAVCNITTFCTYLANPVATHPRTITNNATGCESDTVIIQICECQNDTINPVPNVTTLTTITAQCEVVERDITPPTATDTCAGTITATHNVTAFPITTDTTIIWTYDDGNGNTATQTQHVVVNDTIDPVPDVTTLTTITAQCQVLESDITPPTATDTCAGTITATHNVMAFPITTDTTITWTYDDGNGNTATQTQHVVVKDTINPVPDVVTLVTITAQCQVVESDITPPTATDTCAGTITATHNVTAFPITTDTTITWTFDDGNGNTATQTQHVVVKDTINPVPDVTTLTTITAQCEVVESDITPPTATDTCAGTITATHNVTTFPITTDTTIIWTYDDGNGNTATQTQHVVVNDTINPVPDVVTLVTITAQCQVVESDITPPTATDTCAGTITATHNVTAFPITTDTTITWTFDDGNGNTATQTQHVVVKDTINPVPDVTTLTTITAQCEVVESDITPPTATDTCAGTITATHNVTTFPITTDTTIIWTYDDGNGNTATQTQHVVVKDTINPVPDVTTLTTITAQCEVVERDITPPTATDTCAGTITATHNVTTFPITTDTTIIWTYDDGNGNTATQTQHVVVKDTINPVPDVTTLTTITAQCEVVERDITPPTATDTCAGTITATHNVTAFPITTDTTITWTYDDGNGNTATQTQHVVVKDTIDPVPDVTTLTTITAQCEVVERDITPPTATDTCAGTITATHNVTAFPITTDTTITWTYDDGNGNTATQTQHVVVKDTIDPVPDVTTLTTITAQCEVVESDITPPTATDTCAGTITATHNVTAFPITTDTTITWTYDDGNGNTATQTQHVIVSPITEPRVTSPVTYIYGATATALTATADVGNSLLWYTTQIGGTGSNITPTPSTTVVGTQTYWVSQATANGCESERARIEVNITPATLIVTPNSGQSKVYGSANPVYQYTVTGFVAGDNASVISGNLGRQLGENVGNYPYNAGTLASVNNNYTFTVQQENFAITPASIHVQVNSGQSKSYGASDPVFIFTATGLVNGDTELTAFIGSLQRTPGENVGLHPINQGTLHPNSNYQLLNFTGADFEIVPAPITGVYLNNGTFVYDGTPKSLIVSGNIQPGSQISYTGNGQIDAGTYTVTATVDYGSNYIPLVLPAILQINRAPQTITFELDSPVVLEDLPSFQLNATASSGLPVTYTYTYTGIQPATVSTSGQVNLIIPGIVLISAHQEGNNNYSAASTVTRELVIESRDSSIWDFYIDNEHFEHPSTETYITIGCDENIRESVEIQVKTQVGATVLPSNTIVVATPDYGVYEVEIKVISQNGQHTQTYKVIIEKRMSWENVLMQKYNNVVFVNNNPKTNGGYKFIRYEWYKNGEKVADEQFFSEGTTMQDVLDFNAKYYAVLYTKDSKVITTCPIQFMRKPENGLVVYPNPVNKNGVLTIKYDHSEETFKGGDYVIFNTLGQFMTRGTLQKTSPKINIPPSFSVGAYILVLNVNGKQKSVRFIVK